MDLKRASRPFHFCELDFIGHRWPRVMAIKNFTLDEIPAIVIDKKL
jgi:hypothetical protein